MRLHRLRYLFRPKEARRKLAMSDYRFGFYNLGYRMIGSQEGHPLPPPELVYLVIGTREIAWYQLGGLFASQSITTFLRRNHVDMYNLRSIYDFGCGCGRVLRWFHYLKDQCELWGTDYNPVLVEWCQKNLAEFAQFKVNQAKPPLDFEDNKFDLIYSYSVFTHLARDLQLPWLKELVRVTKPGGHLVITTCGRRVAWRMEYPPEFFDQLEQEGIIVLNEELSGENACAVFHTLDFWGNQQALGLELVDFMEGGVRDTSEQDMYLFKKVC